MKTVSFVSLASFSFFYQLQKTPKKWLYGFWGNNLKGKIEVKGREENWKENMGELGKTKSFSYILLNITKLFFENNNCW